MLSTLVLRTQSDDRLVELAAGGSEAAFEMIVQRYHRELVSYCQRLLRDSRAEDAVQQTFLAAWSALRTGTEVGQLRPWLYRIAHNQAISARRRPGWTFIELSEQISGHAIGHSDVERRMLMRETLAALAALSDAQREAILRTAVEGESYAQAGEAMGLSDTAVRGLVHRARVNLRAAVAVFTPTPLVLWAAGVARRHSGALAFITDNAANTVGTGTGAGAAAVAAKSAAIIASSAVVVGGGLATTHTAILHPSRRLHAVHHHAAPSASRAAQANVTSAPESRRVLRVITDGSTGQAAVLTTPADDPAHPRRENQSVPVGVSSASRRRLVTLALDRPHALRSGAAAHSTRELGQTNPARPLRSASSRHGQLDDGGSRSAAPSAGARTATTRSRSHARPGRASEGQSASPPGLSDPGASDSTDVASLDSASTPTSTPDASAATSVTMPASRAGGASSAGAMSLDTSSQPAERDAPSGPRTTQSSVATASTTGGQSRTSSPAAGSTPH